MKRFMGNKCVSLPGKCSVAFRTGHFLSSTGLCHVGMAADGLRVVPELYS